MSTRTLRNIAAALAVGALTAHAGSSSFDSLWYDGNAEISTYRTVEMRYGQPRNGTRTMVFVTEPMRLSTHVKPDHPVPDKERIKVIKLNDLREFTTGIYEYDVMTSVFTAVEEKAHVPRGATMKLAFSSQEWCGVAFENMVREEDNYVRALHSYFDSEGTKHESIPHHNHVETEDNLWVMIRELQGPILRSGESRTLTLIPSLWSRRKTHQPLAKQETTLSKGESKRIQTRLGTFRAVPFEWTLDKGTTKVWVEAAYPHRILKWNERDGSAGEIMASRREPYWKLNQKRHTAYRAELML